VASEYSEIKRPRRYYLLKRLEAVSLGDTALASVWQAKQEAEPGTALGASFPSLTALAACGYTTTEDVDGASLDELQDIGLTATQATAVLAAL